MKQYSIRPRAKAEALLNIAECISRNPECEACSDWLVPWLPITESAA